MTYKINEQDGEFIKRWFPIFGVAFCREKLKKTTSQIEHYVLKNDIKANKDYQCDIRDYLNIDTPKIIYTLGFLWADGSVTKVSKNSYLISVTVTKKDAKYLKRVLNKWDRFEWKIYNKPAKSRIYKGIEINGKSSTNFYLSDKYISNFLVNNDYQIKSGASAEKILSNIPESLRHYWWRGYFDGDGCFYSGKKNVVQFSSVYNQDWNFCIELCKKLNITYFLSNYENKIGRSSTFNIAKKNDCIKFLDYIYQFRDNDGIGYDRKYQKYKGSNLKPIEKTSKHKGVCLDRSKTVNPWVCYFRGKYIGCAENQDKALELRTDFIIKNEYNEYLEICRKSPWVIEEKNIISLEDFKKNKDASIIN